MLLRAILVVLVMLNLGVAGWWLFGPASSPVAAGIPARTAVPTLRLVGETAAAKPVAVAAVAAPVAPQDAIVAAALPTETPPDMPAEQAAIAQCASFGPFTTEAARDAAAAALAGTGINPVSREVAARSGRGWRVYLPAFASRALATEAAERLRAAGVSDLYLMNEGSEANAIALGRYGSEDAARRREADLQGKGFPARAEPLGQSAPQWWLDARLAPARSVASYAAIAPAKPLDCTRLR